jgi:hypothetical protein
LPFAILILISEDYIPEQVMSELKARFEVLLKLQELRLRSVRILFHAPVEHRTNGTPDIRSFS